MTDLAAFEVEAMTSDELDRVAGGMTIQSGFQRPSHLAYGTTAQDLYVINPPPPIFRLPGVGC
jgi:hypothetical protein